MAKLAQLSPEDQKILEETTPKFLPCCVIPARAGSKRIKHKNIRLLNGRPLIDYALKAAIDSKIFPMIIVSSDDMKVLEHAYSYFRTEIVQPHRRPKPLCLDGVPIKTVVRYCLQLYRSEEIGCLIQPTNPLITPEQIKEAFEVFKEKKVDYLIGMCNGKDIGFHFFHKAALYRDFDQLWDMTDLKWISYEMKGIDIDVEEDWVEAERLIANTNNGR